MGVTGASRWPSFKLENSFHITHLHRWEWIGVLFYRTSAELCSRMGTEAKREQNSDGRGGVIFGRCAPQ